MPPQGERMSRVKLKWHESGGSDVSRKVFSGQLFLCAFFIAAVASVVSASSVDGSKAKPKRLKLSGE